LGFSKKTQGKIVRKKSKGKKPKHEKTQGKIVRKKYKAKKNTRNATSHKQKIGPKSLTLGFSKKTQGKNVRKKSKGKKPPSKKTQGKIVRKKYKANKNTRNALSHKQKIGPKSLTLGFSKKTQGKIVRKKSKGKKPTKTRKKTQGKNVRAGLGVRYRYRCFHYGLLFPFFSMTCHFF
jgi:hypothetical protein